MNGLKLHETVLDIAKHTVYATIILVDENGKKWKFRASTFKFDLKEVDETDTYSEEDECTT